MKQKVKKTVFIRTFGCQMNEYDTEIVRAILVKAGFVLTEQEGEADIVLLNTCAVRENAHRRIFGKIHAVRHDRSGAPVTIGILGCMATSLRDELLEDKNLSIDFIVGPDNYKKLPRIIEESLAEHKKLSEYRFDKNENYEHIEPLRTEGINAWLAVMRGCDNFCTFCVVPYARGRERSRSPENILSEVKQLASEGFKQVTLLGQNVNSYKYDRCDFAKLVGKVSKVSGVERVRFVAPHPKDFPDRLIDVIAANKKVCNHIHLPLQAGNTRILEMMNRTYSQEDFLDLASKIKNRIPDISLTTDVIVGFPTETEEEFEDTVKVMKEVEFDSAFIFKYSPRKGTIASRKYPDDISEEQKTQRIVKLNGLQRIISLQRNESALGEIHEVLVEKKGTQKNKGAYAGRDDANKLVKFSAENISVGSLVAVKITGASPHSLVGEVP